jgi:hypothetical protein
VLQICSVQQGGQKHHCDQTDRSSGVLENPSDCGPLPRDLSFDTRAPAALFPGKRGIPWGKDGFPGEEGFNRSLLKDYLRA